MALITIFIALVFLHSLVSGRLERTLVTVPIGMLPLDAPELEGLPAGDVALHSTTATQPNHSP